tara:strand:+ start:318 stop:593 length:276 start_codon:yes stop_codon:yes gene_type:complete
MNFNNGDFVITNKSLLPGLVIQKYEKYSLVSIQEYNGDYLFINNSEINKINLKAEEELSLLLNYGNWFYNEHKNIFQEIILKTLYTHYKSK